MKELVEEIREHLTQAADPARIAWAKENYPTALHVIGVKVPDLRPIVKDMKQRLRKAPATKVIELAKLLIATNTLECQQVAYELIDGHKPARASINLDDLNELSGILDNWVSVDTFAGYVAGPIWREGQITDSVVQGWANSGDPWWRRAAVVCTVALNQKARGGAGDPERTLDICRMVVAEQDVIVIKALSWALRELAKREVDPVAEFITEYGEDLPALVKREVRRKIETGRK